MSHAKPVKRKETKKKKEEEGMQRRGRNAKKRSVNTNYLSNVGSLDSISVPQTMFAL